MNPAISIDQFLQTDSAFSVCPTRDLSTLLPYVIQKKVSKGTILYRELDDAKNLYFIVSGSIKLTSDTTPGNIITVTDGYFGEEAAVKAETYIATAVTQEETEVLVLPSYALHRLGKYLDHIEKHFLFSLTQKMGIDALKLKSPLKKQPENKKQELRESLGWLLTIISPISAYYFLQGTTLPPCSIYFLSILSASVTMWIFRLVPDFVPGLFAILAALIMGLAPTQTILSGFTSNGFILAMSIFSLGSIIVGSGLAYRIMLIILKHVPPNQTLYNISVLCAGGVFTPIVPSMMARMELTAPFIADLTQGAKFYRRGYASTRLALTSFISVSILAPVFLSSSPFNFLVLGLLPVQDQQQFLWLGWLKAAGVYTLISLSLFLITSSLFFKNEELTLTSKSEIKSQLKLLGPMTQHEVSAIIGFIIFITGVLTSSYHRIPTAWLGLILLFGFLALNFFTKDDFRSKINWPVLFIIIGMIGIANTLQYLQINVWLSDNLSWMVAYMRESFALFLFFLTVLTFALRVFIPSVIVTVILVMVFMPLAFAGGVSPWVVAFCVLVLSETWFLPYQCFYFIPFQETNRTTAFFDEKKFLSYNFFVNFIKIIALFACIPYWRQIGLL